VSRPPILRRKWYFTGHTAFFVWESWSGEDEEEKRKEEEEENPWRDPYFYGEREEEGWEEE
jgi:hypothetical protein